MSKFIKINDAVDKNLEDLEKREFILKANEEISTYKQDDPPGWKEMMDESEEWDVTLLDGLEDE